MKDVLRVLNAEKEQKAIKDQTKEEENLALLQQM